MFKTNNETILIDAKATDPIPTGVVFWSHDRGTAKLIFQLQKDYMNQPLSAGTIVPILLEFNSDTAEGGRGRHIYHAVIEDAINGIVSIVLEDNILGYVGRVTGSIYIELPDSRSLDTAGRFTFDIKRSPIDLNTPELDDYYWQGFNEIMNQYHQTITEIETESERLLNELQARILTLEEKLDGVELRARFKTAWSWSADGTDRFTKVYPNENILTGVTRARSPRVQPYQDATISYTDEQSVPEWGATDAVKHVVAGGTGISDTIVGTINQGGRVGSLDNTWGHSIYVKNVGSTEVIFNNMVSSITVLPGESKRVELINKPNNSNATRQFVVFRKQKSDTLEFIVWHAKIEVSAEPFTEPTIWTPSPIDDPINAYPTYKGISIVDSDNPADYSWQAEDNTIAKKATLDSHTENISNPHKVSKTQVGLGNVDNYSTATQAEAEAGTDTNKFMTPATTAQSIDNRAVTLASNQTVGGLKNFKDGLLVNDVSVLTARTASQRFDSSTSGEIQAGSIKFDRVGPYVFVDLNFQVRADQDITQDQNIFYGLKNELMCDTEYMDFITSYSGVTALINVLQTKMTARTTLVKSTWYVGKTFYKAKN